MLLGTPFSVGIAAPPDSAPAPHTSNLVGELISKPYLIDINSLSDILGVNLASSQRSLSDSGSCDKSPFAWISKTTLRSGGKSPVYGDILYTRTDKLTCKNTHVITTELRVSNLSEKTCFTKGDFKNTIPWLKEENRMGMHGPEIGLRGGKHFDFGAIGVDAKNYTENMLPLPNNACMRNAVFYFNPGE